jgi:hypothetical protein
MPIELTAYQVSRPDKNWVIEPAPTRREWMDQTIHKIANRCLPLTMANQAGWIIRCPVRFKASWTGKVEAESTTLVFPDDEATYRSQILHNFGSGIISFALPWLFRTSPGYGLLVRGPTNFFRPDIVPLDGLVETDWAPFTFTMNWKITRTRTDVWFRQGDPICMLMPYPMELLEQVQPRFADLAANPILHDDFAVWHRSRRELHAQQREEAEKAGEKMTFALDYMRGRMPDGERAPAHRTTLNVVKFADQRELNF